MGQIINVPGHGPVEFPDGMSDEQIVAAIKKNSMTAKSELNIYQRRMGLGRENAQTFEKAMDAIGGYNVGGHATDFLAGKVSPETAGGVGTGVNFLTEVASMLAGDKGLKTALMAPSQNVGRSIYRNAIKPSTTLPEAKIERAVETGLENKIPPTMGGMEKASQRVKELDTKIDEIISGSTGRVSNTAVANRLVDELHRAEAQALNADDLASLRKYWEQFVASHPENISVQEAHRLKKGTYAQLGDRPYNAVQPTADVAMKDKASKALARGYREEVAAAEPAAANLLKEQSDFANLISVANKRAAIEANKNYMGVGVMSPSMSQLALWLLDRSAAGKGILAQQFYQGAVPGVVGALGGGYYGALGGQQPPGILYR